MEVTETINHPPHYGGDEVYECIKVLEAWLSPEQLRGFLIGNTIKYLCRAGKKGDILEDLRKSFWCLNYLIEKEMKNGDHPHE